MENDELKKLNNFVDKNFPCWKDSRTYVTPSVFLFKDDYIPTKGASNYIPDDMDPHHFTKPLEEHVLNIFIRFGDHTKQPMFILPNFKIKAAIEIMRTMYHPGYHLIQERLIENNDYETGLIIIHRKLGIILVEVKSSIKLVHYNKAKEQLERREKVLVSKKYIPCNDPELQKCFIKKVIVCPCHNEKDLKHENSEYIHLCKDHVDSYNNFESWWGSKIQTPRWWDSKIQKSNSEIKNSTLTHECDVTVIESVYNNLVPKLLWCTGIQNNLDYINKEKEMQEKSSQPQNKCNWPQTISQARKFKKLNDFVDDNFPYWKDSDKPRTYVTPPVFFFKDDYIPTKGASNYIPELYDDMDPHHHTASVEEHVLNVFIRFGDYTNQPMFILPNFKIKAVIALINKQHLIPGNQKNSEKNDYETDLIIVHRRFGIILVEVKSSIKPEHYNKAKKQLEDREKKLISKNYIRCNDPEQQKCFITKVIAFPCHYLEQLKDKNSEYIHLCKDHVKSFDNFKTW